MNAVKRIIVTFFLVPLLASAQAPTCGDDLFRDMQRSENNGAANEEMLNLAIRKFIGDHYASTGASRTIPTVYTIPVVFHIVHSPSETYGLGANITYSQVVSQVNALNAAFARNYPQYNGQSHPSYAQNTNIRFCLAKTASPSTVSFYNGPNGTEYGVMRYGSQATQHNVGVTGASSLLSLTHPTSAHFPFANYLNIWIVSSISGAAPGTIMGYAPTPLMGPYPLDGVVVRADITGDNSTGNSFGLSFGYQ